MTASEGSGKFYFKVNTESQLKCVLFCLIICLLHLYGAFAAAAALLGWILHMPKESTLTGQNRPYGAWKKGNVSVLHRENWGPGSSKCFLLYVSKSDWNQREPNTQVTWASEMSVVGLAWDGTAQRGGGEPGRSGGDAGWLSLWSSISQLTGMPLHRLISQSQPYPCSLMHSHYPFPVAFWSSHLVLVFCCFFPIFNVVLVKSAGSSVHWPVLAPS